MIIMMKEKMRMTKTLANTLLDDLACVAISANGGCPMDDDGNIIMSNEQMELIRAYAEETFVNILKEWERDTEKEWVIGD